MSLTVAKRRKSLVFKTKAGWWMTAGDKCIPPGEDSSLFPFTRNNRQPRNRSSNQSLTLTENNNISCSRPGVLEQPRWRCWWRGTYPEYDVESEDKILDAAAHFVSFKMLSWHHLAGFSSSTPPPWEGITSKLLRGEKVLKWSVRGSTKRRRQRLFGCLVLNIVPCFRWHQIEPQMDPQSLVCSSAITTPPNGEPPTDGRWSESTETRLINADAPLSEPLRETVMLFEWHM